jgi:non-heme chloroperoxidase
VSRVRLLLIGVLCALPSACALSHRGGSEAEWQDRSPHRVRFIAVAPDVRLETLDWGGAGPPLVFLSGLQDVAHGFDDFAPRFTDRYHVLAITRRGYGASSQPPSGYDLASRVADLRAVLDSLGLERVALVGHSIAGDELTAFAGAYPARVSRLVYLDAAYDHSNLDFGPPFWLPMTAADSTSPRAVQAYLQRTYGMRIPEAQLRAIGRYDAAGRLTADVTPPVIDSLMLAGCGHPDYARVRAPALLIYALVESARQLAPDWAGLDRSHQELARRFAGRLQAWAIAERARTRRALPGALVLELPGANHYVFASHGEKVERAMRAFLSP